MSSVTTLGQPTHKSNEVNFSDGEGVDFADFDDLQRFLKTYVMDGMLGAEARTDVKSDVATAETQYVFCPQAAVGYPKPSATAMTITNRAGTICQWIASGAGTGAVPKFLKYQLDDDSLSTVLDDNTSGNPRIDLIAVKIEEFEDDSQSRDFEDATTEAKTTVAQLKKIRTRVVKNYVTGTPGASPALPALPAGSAVYCYVFVPNGFTTAGVSVFTNNHLSDHRIPLRVKSCTVYAKDAILGANAAISANRSQVAWTAAGSAWFPLPIGPEARILRIDVIGQGAGPTTAFFRRILFDTTLAVQTTLWADTTGSPGSLNVPDTTFGTQVLNGGLAGRGPAFWGNGFSAGMSAHEKNTGSSTGFRNSVAAVEVSDTAGTSFNQFFVRVFYAA